MLIVILLALILLGFVFFWRFGDTIKEANATFNWPQNVMSSQIPKPPSNMGEIDINDDDNFWVDVRNISKEQYNKYIEACKKDGFIIDSEKIGDSYEAYNSKGYNLNLDYYDSHCEMSIHLDAPEPMREFKWPKSNIAKRVPEPKSTYGRISSNDESCLIVYLGKTSKKDYEEYVDNCIDAGFNIDYNRTEKSFYGNDSDGYTIDIDYEGNDIVFIRIDEPEE